VIIMTQPHVSLKIHNEIRGRIPPEGALIDAISGSVAVILRKLNLTADPSRIEVSVTITNDPSIRLLNAKYRGIDSPTDVLSFPLLTDLTFESDRGDNLPPPISIGDIVISLDTVKRRSAEREQPLAERFIECFIHGILHLLGHDHIDETGRISMERVEDELFPEVMSYFAELGWDEKS